MAVIKIDGSALAKQYRNEIKEKTLGLDRVPGLAVILVGENPASKLYVASKEKACAEVGFYSEKHLLPEDVTEEELLSLIEDLNHKDTIDGILVQLPLPAHIDEEKVINTIAVSKDVDGFSRENIARLVLNEKALEPCTPKGVIALLASMQVEFSGKNAVVIGRSHIVGKPVAQMLTNLDVTVTVCHSKTKNLDYFLQNADIVIVAIGKANFLKPDMLKEGTYVIDVGINRDIEGKVTGDVDYQAFEKSLKRFYLTPVPGGVGPMTIAMLLQNTLETAKMRVR